ncbi:MAG TPA: NADH:ubiquinone oxidoreductase [Thermoplasmatales archaeon]|nr:NADH:ubiquinone oxidoreductase [Thermoplasmatales archaeon]
MIDLFEHIPALLIAVPLLGAFLTPLLGKVNKNARNIWVLLILALTAAMSFLLAQDVYTNGIKLYTFGADIPSLTHPDTVSIPVRIIFEIDGMSVFMLLISVIIGFLAALYSISFIKDENGIERYYTLLLLLITGMIGMELTGDLFNFFVFIEITSISAAALIATMVDREQSFEAAFKYLVLSSIGALFLLLAIGFLYGQYDALNIATIASSMQYTFADRMALVLIIGALALKAGLAPMHMWMPDAYGEAPPSVTIAVMAATLASLYGLIRMCFTLYGSSIFNLSVIGALIVAMAMISIIIGATMALIQSNLTRAIAYAAVAEIGYMLLGIGTALHVGINEFGETALTGGIFHIFNDVLDVGLLFLATGAVIYATNEKSLSNLGGLARKMKFTTIFFLIGLLAAAGMPPMNGFASKIIIYESVYRLNPLLSIGAILASILMLAIFVRIFYSVFLGPELPNLKNVREVPKAMLISMAIISMLIIIFGLFPGYVIDNLVAPAASALANPESYINAVLLGGA